MLDREMLCWQELNESARIGVLRVVQLIYQVLISSCGTSRLLKNVMRKHDYKAHGAQRLRHNNYQRLVSVLNPDISCSRLLI